MAEKQRQGLNVEEGSSGAAGKLVCVTGASGYIASWIVKLLLDRGYTVQGTVRDTADPNKTLHLRALDGANDRLHLFNANLLEEGSFDAAIDGCVCVFHAASPVFFAAKDPKQWYVLSKTLAEEAAWKFSKHDEQEIIVMNPAMVIGPLLQPTLNASVEAILNLINGSSPTCPNYAHGWVNVKDVAMAHILAYEVPSANGRYCIVERVAHYWELVKIISEMYPSIPLPDKCGDNEPLFPTYKVSKDKIRSLGMELIPLETSIKETIESFKEKGFLAF